MRLQVSVEVQLLLSGTARPRSDLLTFHDTSGRELSRQELPALRELARLSPAGELLAGLLVPPGFHLGRPVAARVLHLAAPRCFSAGTLSAPNADTAQCHARRAGARIPDGSRTRSEVTPTDPSDDMKGATAIPLPLAQLRAFCERWGVRRLAVFGSVLRDDFGPDSDVDFLFDLKPEARLGLIGLGAMEAELSTMLGRRVDLVSRRAIEASHNPIRRNAILGTSKVIVDAA